MSKLRYSYSKIDVFIICFVLSRLTTTAYGAGQGALLQALSLLTIIYPRTFLIYLPVSLFEIWQGRPDSYEHNALLLLALIPLLSSVIQGIRNHGLWAWDQKLIQKYFVFVRILVIVFYFFCFFHKLNYGFIDPDKSCAQLVYLQLLSKLGMSDHYIPYIPSLITTTVYVVEGLLPLLMLSKKFWKWSLAGIVLFHFILAPAFLRFSAVMLCLNLAFVPDIYFDCLIKKNWIHRLSICLVIVFLCAFVFGGRYEIMTAVNVGFTIFFIPLWGTLLKQMFEKPNLYSADRLVNNFKYLGVISIFTLVIALISGMLPYLGVRTTGSFLIYSNLTVTSKGSNHFIFQGGTSDFLGYNSERVLIKSVNFENLPIAAEPSTLRTWKESENFTVPLFELKRIAHILKKAGFLKSRLTYVYKGITYDDVVLAQDMFLLADENYLLNKLFKFTPIGRQLPKLGDEISCGRLNFNAIRKNIDDQK